MISVNQLSVYFGAFGLFKEISFLINVRDRIGLVGKNGSGKSTLLKVFNGEISNYQGQLSLPGEISIGYLPQQMQVHDKTSLFEEAMSAFTEVLDLEKRIKKIELLLTHRNDYHSDDYLQLIHELSELNDRFSILDGATIEAKTEQTLLGLGFLSSDFQRQTSEFSGGWRMRIEIAKILLRKTDILLLDEPTNHLDIESIQWLETYISQYQGAVVIISHDRAFLDNVTERTIEISLGKIYDYKVPYSKYEVLHRERREQQLAAFRNQQREIEKNEQFIERFRYKATKAVQVQSRIKQLEKIERIEIDEEDNASIRLRFSPSPNCGNIILEIKNVCKSYGNHQVLDDINFIIEKGERIAFVGKNGEGKTTLSKMIINQLEYEGIIKIGQNVKIGYYAQNQDELMNENKTVFETIDDVATGEMRTKVRDLLGAFLFSGESIDKKVKVLSGGERSRLALAKMLLEPINLLLMDEPTNHLDMASKDILKRALLQFDGTLIIVSHDRDFLNGLTNKVFEFRNKNIKEHIGSIYEYLDKKKIDNLKELERKQKIQKEKKDSEPTDNKILFEQGRELDRSIRKIQNRINACEDEVQKIENEMKDIDNKLLIPENANDHSLYIRYNSLQENLSDKMEEWETLHSELEEWEIKKKNFVNN